MSKYIDSVLWESIIPLSTSSDPLPAYTLFFFTEQDTLDSVIASCLENNCPTMMESKDTFMKAASSSYDRLLAKSSLPQSR